jgi:hypothetical protein
MRDLLKEDVNGYADRARVEQSRIDPESQLPASEARDDQRRLPRLSRNARETWEYTADVLVYGHTCWRTKPSTTRGPNVHAGW